jgi:hypothetical protein
MSDVVVRTSIVTLPSERLAEAEAILVTAEDDLRGILDLSGVIAYFAGVDRQRSQLINVRFWNTGNVDARSCRRPVASAERAPASSPLCFPARRCK